MKKFNLFFATFSVALLLGSYSLFALCELPCPSNIPPLGIPWIPMPSVVVQVTFPDGTVCDYNVCYCWRDVGSVAPFIEIYIKGGGPVDPNCPPSMYVNIGSLVSRLLAEAVMKQNPHNLQWPCPPCPDFIAEYRAYYERCWDLMTPCYGNTYCQGNYQVCCNGSTRMISLISKTMLGDNCISPCLGGCP